MSFVTNTSGSIDVGDWDLARDRVVDECTRCGCGSDSRDVCEHPRYQRRIACGRRGCQRGRDQLTKTSRSRQIPIVTLPDRESP
jgi:hypothetical protein